MKIYSVRVAGNNSEQVRLVKAANSTKARSHVLKIVSVKVASQDDMMLLVGDDAIEVETAGEY